MCFEYQEIEKQLQRLLESVDGIFTESEIIEVREFVEVGEYGVALETFVGIVEEERKAISQAAIQLVEELASRMDMELPEKSNSSSKNTD